MHGSRISLAVGLAMLALVAAAPGALAESKKDAKSASAANPEWTMKASIIEACSCPMFCQCYFNAKPAAHGGHEGHGGGDHFCRFNNAFQVSSGKYGDVSLDGAKFWVAGDLGGDFSKGQMDWAALTFDPSVSKAQRDGIMAILGKVYPVEWGSFTVAPDQPMEWKATKDRAEARLAGGKVAEVVLVRHQGDTDDPVVIHNLKYWGLPHNEGFVLMPNEVEAYRTGDKPFEFKGTNGFMLTFDVGSKDFATAAKASGY